MSIFGSGNSRENEGCGSKLLQKTENLVKKRSNKNSHRSSDVMPNYISQNDHLGSILPQKTYIFWLLILIILFMAIVNFTLLLIMMTILRIGEGMENIEMIVDEGITKFHGSSDLDTVFYDNGVLKGFHNIPVEINGKGGPVYIAFSKFGDVLPTNKLKIASDEISFLNIEKFDVIDPDSGKTLFSTANSEFKIPKDLPNINTKKLRVSRLISMQDSDLNLKSDRGIRFRGNEGIRIQSRDANFSADGDIYLSSVSGSIYLLAENLNLNIKKVPIAMPKAGIMLTSQYKLCVCMPQGFLFKVPVPSNDKSHHACHYADLSSKNNPCSK